jgi:hypothetical protein
MHLDWLLHQKLNSPSDSEKQADEREHSPAAERIPYVYCEDSVSRLPDVDAQESMHWHL